MSSARACEQRRAVLVIDQAAGGVRAVGSGRDRRIFGIDLAPTVERALDGWEVVAVVPGGGKLAEGAVRREVVRALHVDDHPHTFAEDGDVVIAACRSARAIACKHGFATLPCATLLSLGARRAFFAIEARDPIPTGPGFVRYASYRRDAHGWVTYGMGDQHIIERAVVAGWRLAALELDVQREDLVALRIDSPRAVSKHLGAARVVASHGGIAIVALGPEQSIDALGVHGAHGHARVLGPAAEQDQPPKRLESDEMAFAGFDTLALERLDLGIEAIAIARLDWRCLGAAVTSAAIARDVARYSGTADPGGGVLVSRHTQHPDNARAVALIEADLRAAGYAPFRHEFTHGGQTYANVFADLPGRGRWRLTKDIRQAIREALIQSIESGERMQSAFRKLPEHTQDVMRSDAPIDRVQLERAVRLEQWYPWWDRLVTLPGWGAELVLVGCHLDSTSARDSGYRPAIDPAPGVDDDASGIAATLALARWMRACRPSLRHTVRFCFFNAEEQGMVGSTAYAAALKAAAAPVRAVVCMDMIGFNSDFVRTFEVHAGTEDAAVRDLSVPIADRIAAWAASGGSLTAQVHRGTSSASGTDRNVYDPAIGRSDHSSFHAQGYPAVVVSEDFFANPAAEPGADPNPNYHRAGDRTIDPDFAAAIADRVGRAVAEIAS